MTLQVIGAGLGRTGTHSLKLALQQIGFGPCYHMMEVFAHPDHAPMWDAYADDPKADWRPMLAGYRATVDWPTASFWQRIAKDCPEAKIILTERPEDDWYRSISRTILPALERVPHASAPPAVRAQREMAHRVILHQFFGGDLSRENVLACYRRHNAEAKASVPRDQLLIYDGAQGWEPLCRFSGVDVPATDYPKTNSTDEFRSRAGLGG